MDSDGHATGMDLVHYWQYQAVTFSPYLETLHSSASAFFWNKVDKRAIFVGQDADTLQTAESTQTDKPTNRPRHTSSSVVSQLDKHSWAKATKLQPVEGCADINKVSKWTTRGSVMCVACQSTYCENISSRAPCVTTGWTLPTHSDVKPSGLLGLYHHHTDTQLDYSTPSNVICSLLQHFVYYRASCYCTRLQTFVAVGKACGYNSNIQIAIISQTVGAGSNTTDRSAVSTDRQNTAWRYQ